MVIDVFEPVEVHKDQRDVFPGAGFPLESFKKLLESPAVAQAGQTILAGKALVDQRFSFEAKGAGHGGDQSVEQNDDEHENAAFEGQAIVGDSQQPVEQKRQHAAQGEGRKSNKNHQQFAGPFSQIFADNQSAENRSAHRQKDMGDEEHFNQFEKSQAAQKTLQSGVEVKQENAEIQNAVPRHFPGVLHEMENGDRKGHECIEGEVTDRGGHVAQILCEGGIQNAPGAAQQQKAGGVGKAAVPYAAFCRVKRYPDGDQAHHQHDEDDGQRESIGKAVMAEHCAGCADINARNLIFPAAGDFIDQGEVFFRSFAGQIYHAVQLGAHLLVAGKEAVAILIERFAVQQDAEPVESAPGGQGHARVSCDQAVVVKGQNGFCICLADDGESYLHPGAVLHQIPSV